MKQATQTFRDVLLLAWLVALGMAMIWWLARFVAGKTARPRSLDQLCRAIIGRDKASIVRVLGPPQSSAGFDALTAALLVSSDRFSADTWYYALDRAARRALVVEFNKGVAKNAQLLSVPKR
ncbi:MAG TPA: hypothetical protein VKK61_04715 [Tepidisphaeraceae bacterium]|nr:hypothetical protein [Tepidisphaeraceae bacterium]